MSVFEEMEGREAAHADAVERHDRDMREAMRLLMTRREGRVFVRRTLESTNDITHLRAVALMVMEYVEETYV